MMTWLWSLFKSKKSCGICHSELDPDWGEIYVAISKDDGKQEINPIKICSKCVEELERQIQFIPSGDDDDDWKIE